MGKVQTNPDIHELAD